MPEIKTKVTKTLNFHDFKFTYMPKTAGESLLTQRFFAEMLNFLQSIGHVYLRVPPSKVQEYNFEERGIVEVYRVRLALDTSDTPGVITRAYETPPIGEFTKDNEDGQPT